jgi:hypothetical protein
MSAPSPKLCKCEAESERQSGISDASVRELMDPFNLAGNNLRGMFHDDTLRLYLNLESASFDPRNLISN